MVICPLSLMCLGNRSFAKAGGNAPSHQKPLVSSLLKLVDASLSFVSSEVQKSSFTIQDYFYAAVGADAKVSNRFMCFFLCRFIGG